VILGKCAVDDALLDVRHPLRHFPFLAVISQVHLIGILNLRNLGKSCDFNGEILRLGLSL